MDVKAQQVYKIVPIFRINRTVSKFSLSELRYEEQKYSGNGFFISNNGLFASVAHVILSDEYLNHYALINDMLYKIDILIFKHEFNNEVYEDFAIGKIDIENKDWFDVNDFKEVTEFDELVLMGYSSFKDLTYHNIDFDFDCPSNNFHEIKLNKPSDINYDYFNRVDCKLYKQINSFSVDVKSGVYYNGFSGCPIMNKHNGNEIFGLLKGGKYSRNETILQVYKIKVIQDLISDISNK